VNQRFIRRNRGNLSFGAGAAQFYLKSHCHEEFSRPQKTVRIKIKALHRLRFRIEAHVILPR
jgi:hypothetical protein